jgi:ABC-type nitrate/sulfonate/bicarbonate transport system substrate-binding protein
MIRTEDLNAKAGVWPRLLRALLKAERYSQTGDPVRRERTVSDIVKYLKVDPALIDNAYYHGRLDQASDPNLQGVADFWEVMKSIDVIKSNDDIAAFIETGPYREALESLIREEPGEIYWKNALALFDNRNAGAKGGGRSAAVWRNK